MTTARHAKSLLGSALLIGAIFAGPASAEQPNPMEQALIGKLQEEAGQNIQFRASLIQMQQQLVAAEARVKELEAKSEPKVDPAK
jgi:hypothetical protein